MAAASTPRPAAPADRSFDGPGPWLACAVFLGLAVVYFLPAFAVGRHIYGSDYLAGAYFAHDFISERFAAGSLPKWLPYLYGGLPMFANPGSAYYPFRFLADLLFPTSRIFPALYVIQFTLAGIGMYALTRELGARRWIATLAGLAFEFTGLTMSFVLAGHDGRIIVATFAPLALFFLHRAVRTGRVRDFAAMGAVFGTTLLSFQIQSNYYLLLAGAAWAAFLLVRSRHRLSGAAIARRTGLGLAAVVLAFGMAAVNFLPFADYVDASPRGGPGRGYEYATSWSMPPAEISGIALPEAAGVLENYRGENPFKLHTEYVGGVVVLLVLIGAWSARRDPRWWFFALLAIFALSISFGGHTPLYRLYYALLPGTARFRAPSIAFFLVSTALVVMATLSLERLARLRTAGSGDDPPDDGSGAGHRPVLWILVGASAVALLVLLTVGGRAGVDARGQDLARGAFRLVLVTWLAAGAIWLWLRRSLGTPVVMTALAILVVADLWVVDRRFFETVEPPEDMFAADGVVRVLEDQPGPFRVWVLPFSGGGARPYRSGNYLMHHGISQAGGEHGNHIQRWGELVGAGQQTYVDWHNFVADLERIIQGDPVSTRPNFLAAANVRFIVATVQLPGLTEVYRGPEALVYEVPDVLPRAWLAPETVVTREPDGALALLARPDFDVGRTAILEAPLPAPVPDGPLEGRADVVAYEPDEVRIETRASRPAVLVLADTYYDGWEATIDGAPADVFRVDHALRGVVIPEGRHTVTFRFHPADVYAGLTISVAAALVLALGILAPFLVGRRRGSPDPS